MDYFTEVIRIKQTYMLLGLLRRSNRVRGLEYLCMLSESQ